MRIEDVRYEHDKGVCRILATVFWEERNTTPVELYFETRADFADNLRLSAEPFVAACLLPAVRHGEKRLRIAEKICPVFLDNIKTNIDFLRRWYPIRFVEPKLEFQTSSDSWNMPGKEAGMLLSGGIDSLFTLRRRSMLFPQNHPAYITKCILIDFHSFRRKHNGLQVKFTEHGLALYDTHFKRLESAANAVGASLINVRTNLKLLEDTGDFWINVFHGAALASVVHSLGRQLYSATFASADIPLMQPYGSHPLTDPNWSSHALRIHHDTMRFTRLQKTKLVSDWEAGLKVLRVCTSLSSNELNCGRCEKCVRTMLSLIALGKRCDEAPFPTSDITTSSISSLRIKRPYQVKQYQELCEELAKAGRYDLANAMKIKLKEFQRPEMR